jgi:hypothetical protein
MIPLNKGIGSRYFFAKRPPGIVAQGRSYFIRWKMIEKTPIRIVTIRVANEIMSTSASYTFMSLAPFLQG